MTDEALENMGDDSPIWEQMEGEPKKSHDWFRLYRDMGEFRTMTAAYAQFREKKGNPKKSSGKGDYLNPPMAWFCAKKEWRWDERVEAFDNHQRYEKKMRDRRIKQQEEEIRLQRAKELIESEWSLSQQLMAIAREMANHPLYRKAFNEGDRTVIIEPSKWRLGDVPAIAKIAADLGKHAADLDKPKVQELESLTNLIRSGWVGDEVVEPIAAQLGELQETAQRALSGDIAEEKEGDGAE